MDSEIPEVICAVWILQYQEEQSNINNSNKDLLPISNGSEKDKKEEDEKAEEVLEPYFLDLNKISNHDFLNFLPKNERQGNPSSNADIISARADIYHEAGKRATPQEVYYSTDFEEVSQSASQLTNRSTKMSNYTEFTSRPASVISWPRSTPRSGNWTPTSPIREFNTNHKKDALERPRSPTFLEVGSPDGKKYRLALLPLNGIGHTIQRPMSPVSYDTPRNIHRQWPLLPTTRVSNHVCQEAEFTSPQKFEYNWQKSPNNFDMDSKETQSPLVKKIRKKHKHVSSLNSNNICQTNHYQKEKFPVLPPLKNVPVGLQQRRNDHEYYQEIPPTISTDQVCRPVDSYQREIKTLKQTNSTSEKRKPKKRKGKKKYDDDVDLQVKQKSNKKKKSRKHSNQEELKRSPPSPKRERLKLPRIPNLPKQQKSGTNIWQRILAGQSEVQNEFPPLVDCQSGSVRRHNQWKNWD